MTESHNSDVVHDTPSQAIFLGWLAMALMAVTVIVAGIGLYASTLHV